MTSRNHGPQADPASSAFYLFKVLSIVMVLELEPGVVRLLQRLSAPRKPMAAPLFTDAALMQLGFRNISNTETCVGG